MPKKLPSERQKPLDQFLTEVNKHPLQELAKNRLIFAMDATASREPMWDLASNLHAELFKSAKENELGVQLVHFGGFQQFRTTSWNSSPDELFRQMQSVRCLGGMTQIERVLRHILKEASSTQELRAAVYVGDMCEEPINNLVGLAGQLGLRQVPLFMFQEGHDGYATEVFRSLAQRSGGAHMPFDTSSPDQLRALLAAVAVYATQGIDAVRRLKTKESQRLITQISRR